MKLDTRLAFITGGARGIGYAFALECARRSMRLVLTDFDADHLSKSAQALRETGCDVTAYPLDVTDIARYREVAGEVIERFGAPYVLFNNAGVALHGSVSEGTPEDWRWHVNVNILGVGYGLSLFTKAMIESGDKGYVINTASITGLVSSAGGAGIYGATKHAVVALSEALLFDLRPHGMHVCVLCPGSVHTEIADSDRHTRDESGKGLTPVSDAQRQATRALVAHGLPTDAVIGQLFQAMEERKFYVVSHPEYKTLIISRHRQIESSIHGEPASDAFLVRAAEAGLAAFPPLDQPNILRTAAAHTKA